MRTLQQRMKATAVALVMSSIATSSGGQIAHAQSTSSSPPPTLNGEGYLALNTNVNNNSVQCNSDGSGTFTYTATGTASGPYSGPFTETGTVTIDSSSNATGTASFTITSPQGTVTGSETLVPAANSANCMALGGSLAGASSTYQATIATPNGNYADQLEFRLKAI